jgi:hypothetical protein
VKVDHIARAMVPWHEPASETECGRAVDDVASLVTRAEVVKKIEREGQQRALYSTCQTCLSSARRHPEWKDDPLGVVTRHFTRGRWDTAPERRREVMAIAVLIETHRDEFDSIQRDLAATNDLVAAREHRATRIRSEGKRL